MKTLMTSAIVLGLLAGTPALAQNQKQERQAERADAKQQRQAAKPARQAQPARAQAARPAAQQKAQQPRAQQQRAQQQRAQQQRAQQQRANQAARRDQRQDARQVQQQRAKVQTQQQKVQRQQQQVRAQRQDLRQDQRQVQQQRAQVQQQQRRWDRTQDRSWYENRWNGRARNFNAQTYRRAFNSPRRYQAGAFSQPSGWSYRRWDVGSSFPTSWLIASIFINNWTSYGLSSPPWGYEWVRSGPDAVLVDVRTGAVLQVRYNAFY